ncbi:MAG: hypothetical protein EP343_07640 [Deltaproteobacteria bacterium]|nr:MAG: hypothetical protein EP343_07640 [Deltaproteobacteria bacterium]
MRNTMTFPTQQHSSRRCRLQQRKRRREAGMSLMEVLVAIFLLSMIGLATADIVWRSNRTRNTLQRINDVYHSSRVVLDRMARELSTAYIAKPLPGPDQSKIPQTIFKAKDESPIARLTFSSFSHIRMVRDARESDQNILTYYGKPHPKKSGVYRLFRRSKTIIDGQPEKGGLAYELLDNVVSLEFKYWDRRKTDWQKDWDTTRIEYGNRLPPLVEIKLVVQDQSGQNITFLTRTRIFMRELLQR